MTPTRKSKPKITPARDRELKMLAYRLMSRLARYGWLTLMAGASDKPERLILDELRRTERWRKP